MTLKELRERAKLTQEDVGRKLNIHQSAVCHWETGNTKPARKYHKKLTGLYSCTIDELLSAIPQKEISP